MMPFGSSEWADVPWAVACWGLASAQKHTRGIFKHAEGIRLAEAEQLYRTRQEQSKKNRWRFSKWPTLQQRETEERLLGFVR
jgi:hypothetical protein